MLSLQTLLLILLVYIFVLFVIAQWANSSKNSAVKVRKSATTYALSLAVFCTSWTFYGNVALSSRQGILPIALYLGSTITFIFMVPLLKKMVLLKNEFHSTSIADFISVRYNRSQSLAALISTLCLIGIVPYLTIQLKSVINTFKVLVPQATQQTQFFEYFDILIVLMMAFFTIFFGVRHLDPTEKHPGMMVALAFESLIKLFALLIGAFWISYIMNPGVVDLFSQVEALAKESVAISSPSMQSWLSFMVLGALGIITLPRQFHVGIVECSEPEVLDRAKWLFPLYLILINIFALPIALVGILNPDLLGRADILLLTLPLSDNAFIISLIVFLGGFAAATGMIMISAMTLSTMVTNHLFVPFIQKFKILSSLKTYLLQLRWCTVVGILFLSLFYYRAIGDSELIIKIGAISFVACVQFAPSLIGGLVWKEANLKGALIGLLAGGFIWFYCSLLPSVIRSGWLDWDILNQKSGIFYWFDPEHLFAIAEISPVANGLLWSLLANLFLYIGISLMTKMSDEEYKIAHQFVDTKDLNITGFKNQDEIPDITLAPKISLIDTLFKQYMPDASADKKLLFCLEKNGLTNKELILISELSALKNTAVNALAGVIGMASAYHAFNRIDLISLKEQQQLGDCFSKLFSQLHLSPSELFEQVNFYQEKRDLLENHANQQLETITKLEIEIKNRIEAESEVKTLNLELEQRVAQRTHDLTLSNHELSNTLSELKHAQKKLLEADKMAALGGLVAGVAHEINTPIGVVLMAISHMKEQCLLVVASLNSQTLTSNQLNEFTQILDSGFDLSLKNIERAITQIESFKQVAVEGSFDEIRSINLYEYIHEIVQSLDPHFKDNQHQLIIECPKGIEINTYPGAMSQIISNLVMNSLNHAFEDLEGNILISVERKDGVVELLYSDDGQGLSLDAKNRIFEPFYTTKRGAGFSGLGAHLIYNLVTQRLKGEIELVENYGPGTHFKITFDADFSVKNLMN